MDGGWGGSDRGSSEPSLACQASATAAVVHDMFKGVSSLKWLVPNSGVDKQPELLQLHQRATPPPPPPLPAFHF